MHIVGITGQIGHGKSTFAKLLAECAASALQIESHQVVMDVANAWQAATTTIPAATHEALNSWIQLLPPIIQRELHVETDEALLAFTANDEAQDPLMFAKLYQYVELLNVQPQLLTQTITAEQKELYRPLLSWLGGYLVKMVSPGVWYDEIVRRIKALEPEKYELVIVSGLRFPGDADRIMDAGGVVIQVLRPLCADGDQTDPTERERTTVQYQVTVYNDGSLANLAVLAWQIHTDIVNGRLQPVYHAGNSL